MSATVVACECGRCDPTLRDTHAAVLPPTVRRWLCRCCWRVMPWCRGHTGCAWCAAVCDDCWDAHSAKRCAPDCSMRLDPFEIPTAMIRRVVEQVRPAYLVPPAAASEEPTDA